MHSVTGRGGGRDSRDRRGNGTLVVYFRIQRWKYDDRLKYLGLMHLERKRVRSDLIETFKIMKRMYDINKEPFL